MKVGIVGAGVSGVATGAHLKAAGIDITVFERSAQAGGVWLYDDRLPPEPKYPSTLPSEADCPEREEQVPNDGADLDGQPLACEIVKHAPPGSSAHMCDGTKMALIMCEACRPCYKGLTNNVSTRLMKMKLNSWPAGTEDYVNHRVLNEYIQDTCFKTGVHSRTYYDTRVEKVLKSGKGWKVHTSALTKNQARLQRVEREWTFDAVVVASGHYHACRIPDIPGLAAWKKQWPTRVQHSKSYRDPADFQNQNVLLIGAGVSSTDIAREIAAEGCTITQLSRNGVFDLLPSLLPPGATRIVGEVRAFESLPGENSPLTDPLTPIPGRVFLKDGRALSDFHRVILCTGYHMSLPFLRQYHSDDTPVREADDDVLVTDGTQIHNLHKDIFYIPDPSLVFVGVPFFTATFSLFEFQAIAVAAVLAGRASLPSARDMRSEYEERVGRKGSGKVFHSLREREDEYVVELLEWVNRDGRRVGALPVEGHTVEWFEANHDRLERVRKLFGKTA